MRYTFSSVKRQRTWAEGTAPTSCALMSGMQWGENAAQRVHDFGAWLHGFDNPVGDLAAAHVAFYSGITDVAANLGRGVLGLGALATDTDAQIMAARRFGMAMDGPGRAVGETWTAYMNSDFRDRGLWAVETLGGFGIASSASRFAALSRAGAVIPEGFGGAAYRGGRYVHDIVPRSNVEIYGEAIIRTPAEAKEILVRIGHDAETLENYQFVSLTPSRYEQLVQLRGGEHFDATYGNVAGGRSVSFADIESVTGTGAVRIPVYVHPSVFGSDEAIAQVLSHEIYEMENLRYEMQRPISRSEHYERVGPNVYGNLHQQATGVGDAAVLRFRNLLGGD